MRPLTGIFFCTLLLFFISFRNIVNGQLCSGSLGEPVVNITFGSGPGNGPSLDSAVTNYNYIFGSCPDDGNYTLANQVPSCFGSTWHSVPQDHTPNDTNGYMMVVNASFAPGDFYLKKVEGLCDNTTYEFAAWILNELLPSSCNSAGIKPNVTFGIEKEDGTILQTYQTGDIPDTQVPTWKQYGVFFQTPVGVNTVIIRMTNNAPGGCGNDLILDDITFRPCGPLVDVSISNTNTVVTLCKDDTTNFTFVSTTTPAGGNTIYQWQKSLDNGQTWQDIPGASGPGFYRTPEANDGVYLYRLAVAQGDFVSVPSCSRVMSKTLTVNQPPLPDPGATSNGPVCEGSQIRLNANSGSLYSWNGPNNFQSIEPAPEILNASQQFAGRYYLTFTSPDGCTNTDSTDIQVLVSPQVDAGPDTTICEGTSIRLKGSSNTLSFQWSPATSLSADNTLNPLASPDNTTTYILKADNGVCPQSDSVKISVLQLPVIDGGPDKIILKGDSTSLDATSNVATGNFLWLPNLAINNNSILNPTVSPALTTTYMVTATSQGCGSASDTVEVKVFPGLLIPNAFTPNNDGINDVWTIQTLVIYPQSVLRIYNRYGQEVFSTVGGTVWWNGEYKNKPQPVGSYPYTLDLKNGTKIRKGVLYLVR